jgi:hypothetical protein
MEVELKN